ISFVLDGKKLKGEFSRLKLRKAEKNAWLLIKKRDAFATAADVLVNERSVVSRRTMAAIGREKGRGWKSKKKSKRSDPKKRSPPQVIPSPDGQRITVSFEGRELQLTNLQKVYWRDENYRKGDLIAYYHQIAEYILPYLKDRPQSLNRHPNGVEAQS